jgi:hypothetical protein
MRRGLSSWLLAFAASAVIAAVFLTSGVNASVDTSTWQFRVTGGADVEGEYVSGQLQMRPNAIANWGGVCATGFTIEDAKAACASVGFYIPGNAVVRYGAPLAPGALMYLGNVSCGDGSGTIANNCTFNYSSSGAACSPSDGVGVDCITGTAAPTSRPSYTFFALFWPDPKEYVNQSAFESAFKQRMFAFYGDRDDTIPNRIIFLYDNRTLFPNGTVQYNVSWQIGDAFNENGLFKGFIEETLVGSAAMIFKQDFGLKWIASNAPPPIPRVTYDTAGWKWRVAGGSNNAEGRLEVYTTQSQLWGTVCGSGWTASEAYAACGSLGFPQPPWAVPIIGFGGGNGLIALSSVRCDSGQEYLTQCSFKLSTPEVTKNACIHEDDVGVNCFKNTTLPPGTRPPPTYGPDSYLPLVAWTATVYKTDYRERTYIPNLALLVSIDQNRIKILNTTSDADFVYVTFVFLQGPPSEPASKAYDSELAEVDAHEVLLALDTIELINNSTGAVLTLPPAANIRWNVSLSEGTRGLVWITPSTGGDRGTICSTTLRRDGAAAVCTSINARSAMAAVIPGYNPSGSGTIYLDQVTCSPGATLNGCAKRTSVPGAILNNCTHDQDAGVMCYNLTSTIAPNRNANVSRFTAYLNNGRIDLFFLEAALNLWVPFNRTRLYITSVGFQRTTGITTVNFFVEDMFVDDPTPEPPREVLEYWLQHVHAAELQFYFNIYYLTWTYGVPVLRPPPQVHSLEGWQFKLSTGGKKGVLLAKPPGDPYYGGVCGFDFTTSDAVAACRTLGFDTDFAIPYTYADDDNIVLSLVDCPPPSSGATLSQCNSTIWSSSNLNVDCPRNYAVTLDCAPNSDAVFAPMLFTAVVRTDVYTAENFSAIIARDMNISAARVVVSSAPSDGTYTFVGFEFIDDGTVNNNQSKGNPDNITFPSKPFVEELDHVVHALSVVVDGSGAGLTAPGADSGSASGGSAVSSFSLDSSFGGSMGTGFGSIDGKLPLYGSPKQILEYVMRHLLTPTVLFKAWGIYELRDNTTKPNGNISETSKATWRLNVINLVNSTPVSASRYGRLELQPGEPNAPWGTVSSYGFDHSDALIACRTFLKDPNIMTALAIPYFVDWGYGIIYLGNVNCNNPLSADFINGCSYNFSTKLHKTNNATHNDDVGLICGRDVVPDPSPPVTYRMGFDPNRETVGLGNQVATTIARLLNVSVGRISAAPWFDNWVLMVIVNITVGPPATAAEPSTGHVDLFLQSINDWGLQTLFGAVSFEASVNVVPEHTNTPAPTEPDMNTTRAPPPTSTTGAPPSGGTNTTVMPGGPTTTNVVPQSTPSSGTTTMPSSGTSTGVSPTSTSFTATSTTGTAPTGTGGGTTTTAGPTSSGTTVAPVPPTTTGGVAPGTTTPAPPPATTTQPSPPPSQAPVADRSVIVTYDSSKSATQIAADIAAFLGIPVNDVAVVSTTTKNGKKVVELSFKTLAQQQSALAAANSEQDRAQMGIATMAAAKESPPAPAPADNKMMYYYIAGGAGALLLVIVVIAIVIIKKRGAKGGGQKYHDEYVQMTSLNRV